MKTIDKNGWWLLKHNIVSCVGVFPYLGSSISDECEPNKIYYVYRPAETLKNSIPSWDNPPKPVLLGHYMLGDGFESVDDRPIQGVMDNPVFENDALYADITIYSDNLKEAIQNNTKEISLGYFCKYRKEKGVYKGQAYDYVQENMEGNHLAIVENGRCGSDVKVFDSKCTMDSLDITTEFQSGDDADLKKNASDGIIKTTEEKDSEMADKREYIRKIMAIAGKPDSDFEGGEKEKIETIAKLLEDSEYAKSEAKDEEEAKKETEDKCGKDEESEKEEKAEDKCGKDEDEEKKAEDEDLSPADVYAYLKMILDEVRLLNGKKATDEEEKEEKAEDEDDKKSEDEDEEKKSEDEDEEKAEDEDEEKKAEDSSDVVVTFAKDNREAPKSFSEDAALRKYLNI